MSELNNKNKERKPRSFKRKLIQLYSALLFNCYLKGYVTGDIFKGVTKNVCTPGLNCYSCPGAVTACPLGAIQNAFYDSGKRAPYYMLGILMLYGVLLGRWICGWLCPFGFVQELLYKIKTPKIKKNPVTRVLSYLKYPILVLFVVVMPLLYMLRDFPLPAFCKYICPAGTFGGAIGLLINPENADKFGMLGGLFTWKFILMVSVIVGCVFIYRMFCRFLCPLGALYGLFNKVAIFGIKLEKKSCISCGRCVEACKMDIRRVGDMECISCGKCIPVCPTKAISWKGKSIILPDSEIEAAREEIRVSDPESSLTVVIKERAIVEKKRAKRVTVITAAVSAILILILGAAITYFNFFYDEGTVDPFESVEEGKGSEESGATEEINAPLGNKVGNKAPSMELEQVYGGDTLSIADLKGKIVVVNFWGTWCGPCKAELPHFEELAEEFEEEAEFYIVHTVTEADTAKAYLDANFPDSKMRWVFDKQLDGLSADWYFYMMGGSSYYPRTVVIDENGIISFAIDGAISYDELKGEITKHIAVSDDQKNEEPTAQRSEFIAVFVMAVTILVAASTFFTVIYLGIIRKPKEKGEKTEKSE